MELGTTPKAPAFHEQPGYLERLNWPSALIKSVHDEFMYALKLKTGECWFFGSASYSNDEFVILRKSTFEIGYLTKNSAYASIALANGIENLPKCERGIEVRVADIVWLIDAPFGS
jgi:hypothetical protein